MYVAALDRPWSETPFAFQGFALRSERQLAALRAHCRHVFVDPERSEAVPAGPAASRSAIRGSAIYEQRHPVEKELDLARRTYQVCQRALGDTLSTLQAGGDLDAGMLQENVRQTTDSIVRNPDAMLLVARLRDKGAYEFRRALDCSVLMITFGRFLQLDRSTLEHLGLCGLLLDVGKLRVPGEILNKPAALGPEEYEAAKRHVTHAGEILRAARRLPPGIADVVLRHHERHNGSGYPLRLRGDAIGPLGSMAAIVDSFSALVSTRPYAGQLPPSNAMSVLYKSRAELYHRALVEQFIQCIGVYPVGAAVELSSGETALVLAQNPARKLQPRIAVVRDAEGHACRPHRLVDLAREPKGPGGGLLRIRRTLPAQELEIDLREFML
jgi:HD-GYP domain-containing protein (c-di-GMP phosphodiesterase class II)